MTDMLDHLQAFGNNGIEIFLEKTQLKRARSLEGVLKYLNENRPDGILVTDPGIIVPKNLEILGRLNAFAQSGGTVVFSFCFASNINRITWTASGGRAGIFPGRWVTITVAPCS